MEPQYFEHYVVGETQTFGSYRMTEEKMVNFAERYDPQPVHVDEAAAADTRFGGLIASGWHTAIITLRILNENLFLETGIVIGIGLEELRWINPVHPNDVLSVEMTILNREDRDDNFGRVKYEARTSTEEKEVLVMTPHILVEKRS